MLRPEAYGGLLHNTLMKDVVTPLPASILTNTVSISILTNTVSISILTNDSASFFLLDYNVRTRSEEMRVVHTSSATSDSLENQDNAHL